MHITFVSNYINHHQLPFCEEMFRLTEGNFTFLQTEPMTEERIKMGWDAGLCKKPYVMQMEADPESAKKLIFEDDVIIFGGTESQELIIPRLEAGKFTVRYSERIYKSGRWKFISPRGLKQKHFDHSRFKYYPVYLLCAGAHVAGDFKLIGAYPHKMLKFGYFPATFEYEDVHSVRKKRREQSETAEILWAARFIDWKHPEMMNSLATGLKGSGYDFHITMVGDGELLDSVRTDAKERGLENEITFVGAKTPDEVRELMLAADVFVSTSDRLEGWGAVVNEAMNSGCVTIAARDIGAAPYLITNGVNGYTYKACHKEGLYHRVVEAIDDKEHSEKIGNTAYETVRTLWNAKLAAERLYKFVSDPEHKMPEYDDGPLSRA